MPIEPYRITRVMIDDGREVCVRLAGDFDEAARDELRRALTDALTGNTAPLLVVDLHETRFLGSEAIGELLGGLLRARAAGKQTRIINAHGIVRTVLVVTGVLDLFDTPPAHFPGEGGAPGVPRNVDRARSEPARRREA